MPEKEIWLKPDMCILSLPPDKSGGNAITLPQALACGQNTMLINWL